MSTDTDDQEIQNNNDVEESEILNQYPLDDTNMIPLGADLSNKDTLNIK